MLLLYEHIARRDRTVRRSAGSNAFAVSTAVAGLFVSSISVIATSPPLTR